MGNKVLKVGVTGGIGSGKSYVCALFREKGFPVYHCDEQAKRLMVEDAQLVGSLKALVGNDAYLQDGTLNKKVVASFLFSDAGNAQRINHLVHPRVKDDFLQWLACQTASVVFMESAILFESGFESLVDTTLMVFAPLQVRLQRVMQRDAITEEVAMSRVKAQMDEQEKLRKADLLVINDGTSDLESQINETIAFLTAPSEGSGSVIEDR